MPNAKNQELVKALTDKITRSKSIIFADFLGLKVNNINTLRATMKEHGAEVTVAKNTLIKVALDEAGVKSPEVKDKLDGPTSAIFSYDDAISPIKSLYEFIQKFELPKVKSAIIDGIYTTADKVAEISKLPTKEELIARLLGGLNSPISGLVNVLHGTQSKLVYAFSAIAEKKTKEEGGVK